jgi:hypothetical protein
MTGSSTALPTWPARTPPFMQVTQIEQCGIPRPWHYRTLPAPGRARRSTGWAHLTLMGPKRRRTSAGAVATNRRAAIMAHLSEHVRPGWSGWRNLNSRPLDPRHRQRVMDVLGRASHRLANPARSEPPSDSRRSCDPATAGYHYQESRARSLVDLRFLHFGRDITTCWSRRSTSTLSAREAIASVTSGWPQSRCPGRRLRTPP